MAIFCNNFFLEPVSGEKEKVIKSIDKYMTKRFKTHYTYIYIYIFVNPRRKVLAVPKIYTLYIYIYILEIYLVPKIGVGSFVNLHFVNPRRISHIPFACHVRCPIQNILGSGLVRIGIV